MALLPWLGSDAAWAGSGKIEMVDDHIEVEMSVHVGFAPNQADIDYAAEMLPRVAGSICDATDGVVRITTIRLGAGAYSEPSADVVWSAPGMLERSGASSSVLYGQPENLAKLAYSAFTSETLTHELGHSLLGIKDQYDEQRRFGTGCGIGRSFETGAFTQAEVPRNHTTMDALGDDRECSNAAQDVTNGVACIGDITCAPYLQTGYGLCAWSPVENSELSVESNFDLVRGDAFGYPGTRPGNELVLSGTLQGDEDIGVFDPDNPVGTTVIIAKDDYELFDAAGDLSDGQGRLSSHLLRLFVSRDDDFVWTLHFAIDGGDLEGGEEGVWEIFGTVELEFDSGGLQGYYYPLLNVNGVAYVGDDPTITLDGLKQTGTQSDLTIRVGDLVQTTLTGGNSSIDPMYPPNVSGAGSKQGSYYQFLHDGKRQLAECGYSSVDASWNEGTQRFEGSAALEAASDLTLAEPGDFAEIGDGSDWNLMTYLFRVRSTAPLMWLKGQDPLLVQSAIPNLPVAAPGSICEDVYADVVIDTTTVNAADRVYLVFDTSGSMKEEWNNLGTKHAKREWALAGAKAYVDYVADDGVVELGLIGFDHEVEIVQGAAPVVTDTPQGNEVSDVDYKEAIDGLDASGSTNIAQALLAAKDELEAFADDAKGAVMLLTDGAQTTGNMAPEDAADLLWDADIPIMVSPIGDFPAEDAEQMAVISRGATLPAVTPVDLPEVFMEHYAERRGEQVVLRHVSAPLASLETESIAIPVEQGAQRLNILLTNHNDDLSVWPLEFDLYGPAQEHISESDTQYVTTSQFNHLKNITIATPSVGEWELVLRAPSGAGTQTTAVMAHVENPLPDCRIGVPRGLATATTDPVELRASAAWAGGDVFQGVSFDVDVRRPDGSVIDVTLVREEDGPGFVGAFSDFNGRGQYEVVMSCVVEDGASIAQDDREEADADPLETAPSFTRRAREAFFADLPSFTPKPGGDCDEDGFSDAIEGSTSIDSDGDGIPDLCDGDSDGDDLPDQQEGTGDIDGDGAAGRLDVDSDDDGDLDGVDLAATDAAWNRYARGDFDGDGRLDEVRGEPAHDNAKGRIVVDFADGGQQSLNRNTVGIEDTSNNTDNFGESVAVGDFNDDGWDDLAVGVPGDDVAGIVDAGSIHVLYGSASGLSTSGDQVWHQDSSGVQGGAEAGDRFGTRLTTGDFDGNGAADVVIGSPNEAIGSYADAGAVNVLYGDVGGVSSVDDLWYQGTDGVNDTAEGGDKFGDGLAAADFDSDDYADLVIGAPDEDYGAVNSAGYVYALYGTVDGLSTAGDFGFFQSTAGWAGTSEASDRLGARFWIDDRDGDGYDDLTAFVAGDGCGAGTHGYHVAYGDPGGLSSSGNALECLEAYQLHE